MLLAQGERTQRQQNNSQGVFKLFVLSQPRYLCKICAIGVPNCNIPSILIQDPVGDGGQLLLRENLKAKLYFEAFEEW